MRRIFIFLLLLTISLYNVKTLAAFYPEQEIFTQNGNYFLHAVEQGQTVFSISRMYHVTVEDIYKLNPGSREGIKTGAQLKIPKESGSYLYHTILPKETLYSVSRMYRLKGEDLINANPGLSTKTFTIGKVIRIPTGKTSTNNTPAPITASDPKSVQSMVTDIAQENESVKTVRVALLLPFADNARMVEYLEGFLLALEDIKKQGISVDLQMHNIGQGVDTLSLVLEKQSMQTVHLIVGGVSDSQIRLIAGFSRAQNIPYVVPFASRNDEVMTNPTVYQINTPQSYLYSKASTAFSSKYRDAKIVFHIPLATGNRADFIQVLQKELTDKNIPYQVLVKAELSVSDVSALLEVNKNTVFVPSDDGVEALSKLIIPLRDVLDSNPQLQVSLFGYSRWQESGANFLSDLLRFNATFFSVFYVNTGSEKFKSFYGNYFRWYSKELINVYPKYGLLGYDTGMFFVQALNNCVNALAFNMHTFKHPGIQIDFNFERVSNRGGFINTNVYFVSFLPNGTIVYNSVK